MFNENLVILKIPASQQYENDRIDGISFRIFGETFIPLPKHNKTINGSHVDFPFKERYESKKPTNFTQTKQIDDRTSFISL